MCRLNELKAKHLKLIERGVPERKFGGLNGFFAWLERKKYKMHIRVLLSRYRSYRRCPECEGKRLKPEALAYRIRARTCPRSQRCAAMKRFRSLIRLNFRLATRPSQRNH
jgi:excinuclease ABC subunit A